MNIHDTYIIYVCIHDIFGFYLFKREISSPIYLIFIE